jgi:LuxR family maltose regulon positive regulatory protein
VTTPVLVTKLFIPPPRPNAVPRPRLLERLNNGLHRPLTLISAPAGSGKTTLVSEWVTGVDRATAWLSLDEGDSDPSRFLAYFIAALRTVAPHAGDAVLGALQSPQPPPAESLLTVLLNEVSTLPDPFILVLDDYHLVDAEPVDRMMTFLLEHLPPRMHLVIATREDPPLPLVRLRARDQLTELRASDLRFTSAEAADFLNQVMGLCLSTTDVAALEERTEGWIAGLQLAALSMQGIGDVSEFIRSFAGNHRYVVDYLIEEVLKRQSEQVRGFLLQTAILGRLHGPLCDAVTGREDGIAQLEALERGNFFVVPLDDQRRWYRYHRLFADVLRAHLQAEQPDQVATLHLRASEWYERHGSMIDAVRHALAAEDFARTADLIEQALPVLRRDRLGVTLLGWLKQIPDEMIRNRPVLSVLYAWGLLASGELEAVESRLREAERWLAASDVHAHPEMVVVDEEEFRRLPGTIAIYRAAQAQMRGDVAASVTHAQQALDLVPDDDDLRRGSAGALLGLASWEQGDLETAQRAYAAGMASLQRAGLISDIINGATTRAEISVARGRLREAERTLELAAQRAEELGEPSLHGLIDFLIGMSELRRERNELSAATDLLLRAQDLAVTTGVAHNRSRWYVAMARIKEAQGDLDGALDELDEAERLYVRDFFPNVRPIAALKARVWIAQGRLDDALNWAREAGLSTADDLDYLGEFEHVTLARILMARSREDRSDRSVREAVGLLDRLLPAAEERARTGSVIEILLLQALAHQTRGDLTAALAPLERAFTMTEPEGYVRIFLDEGQPMATLLQAAAKQGIATSYARRLLTAFGTAGDRTPAKKGLIEPLSERELDVLRLLGSDLSGPEIAYELNVSLNTVRTHTKNIYSKLQVNTRRAAVRRAEELGLV